MSKANKKLFLLDAMALIYRAHFAFSKNPRINSKGLNTGVMLGFTNTLLEILEKEKPNKIVIWGIISIIKNNVIDVFLLFESFPVNISILSIYI